LGAAFAQANGFSADAAILDRHPGGNRGSS